VSVSSGLQSERNRLLGFGVKLAESYLRLELSCSRRGSRSTACGSRVETELEPRRLEFLTCPIEIGGLADVVTTAWRRGDLPAIGASWAAIEA